MTLATTMSIADAMTPGFAQSWLGINRDEWSDLWESEMDVVDSASYTAAAGAVSSDEEDDNDLRTKR